MKFLDTLATMKEVSKLLDRGGPTVAAVSYWGSGAIKYLNITKETDLTVVCDILSGGCNPNEIEKLIKILGKKRVLTFNRLHSKIWIGKTSVILGSSNASSNGLGFEGIEASSLFEANIALTDENILAAAKKWFTEVIYQGAREITDLDLRQAKKMRKQHRKVRPIEKYKNIFVGLQTNPESFKDRDLYVWIWNHDGFDKWVNNAGKKAKKDFGEDIDFWQDIDAPPPPGAYVIDFDSTEDPPALMGIYRILCDNHIFKTDKGRLLLRRAVKSFEGMQLGPKSCWRAAAKAAILEQNKNRKVEWEGTADEFAQFINK